MVVSAARKDSVWRSTTGFRCAYMLSLPAHVWCCQKETNWRIGPSAAANHHRRRRRPRVQPSLRRLTHDTHSWCCLQAPYHRWSQQGKGLSPASMPPTHLVTAASAPTMFLAAVHFNINKAQAGSHAGGDSVLLWHQLACRTLLSHARPKDKRAPVPKWARREAGACSRAVSELVGPSSARQAGTASAPSNCIATIGPLVMNSAGIRPHKSYLEWQPACWKASKSDGPSQLRGRATS